MRRGRWLVLLLLLWTLPGWAHLPLEVTVARVLDGDTFDVRLDTGAWHRTRLIGLNAAEVHDITPCGRRWAQAATAALTQMVLGQTVRLVFDRVLEDKYHRWLVYAYVGEKFINAELLAEGLARYSDPGKNTAHRALLQAAAAGAQLEEVGMWKP